MKLKSIEIRSIVYALVTVTIAFVWSACDVLEKDVDPDNPNIKIGDTKVYIPSSGSAFIDLNSLVKSGAAVQFSVSSLPKKGSLNELGKGLLQYSPGAAFTNGRDGFAFSILNASNKILRQDSVIIIVAKDSTQLPCAIYAINDFVYNPAGTTTIDVMKNDILCGVSNPQLSIFLPPLSGSAVVANSKIQYTPAPGFQGNDRIFYKVTSASDTSKHAYGQVFIASQAFKVFSDSYLFKHDTLTASPISLRVFQNDSLPGAALQYVASVTSAPHHGTVSVNGMLSLNYTPDQPPAVLTDSLTYRVCKGSACLSAKVYIRLY